MKYGHLSDQRRTKSGYGLRLTEIRGELPERMPDAEGALGLWNSLPESCRKNAVFYTDFWSAYKEIFPQGKHFSVGKTNHMERLNLTLRQRVSRLGRKTFSFSKNMKNHIGPLWNFIHHHYNENIASNLATTP